MFPWCDSRVAWDGQYFVLHSMSEKFLMQGIAKIEDHWIDSEILLEGNSNFNFDPVVAHKTVELMESYRSPEKQNNVL